jgi:outer membrane protein assembly factor BamB
LPFTNWQYHMTSLFSRLAALLLASSLAACGGGGSGGSGGGVTRPSGDWLTLSSSSQDISTYEGEQVEFTITGKFTRSFSKPVYAAIISSTAIIDTQMQIYPGQNEYMGMLRTGLTLAPGVHTNNLELRLCEDDPRVCKSPVAGSPWMIPLKVTVKSKAEGAKRVQVSAPLELETHEGEGALFFEVEAKVVSELGRWANFAFIAPASVVEQRIDVQHVSNTHDVADMRTLFGLAPGTYSGNIEVRACMDNPSVCALPMAGSPWLVPLKLTVKPNVNLTPLAVPATAVAWSTFQANAAHTGAVAGNFDPAKFSRRWIRRSGATDRYNNTNIGVAIENGRVFNTSQGTGTLRGMVQAISEATGAELWRVDLGPQDRVSAAAAADGKVIVTTSGANGALFVLDQATGAQIAKISGSSQSYTYRQPVVYGGNVYTQDGYYGGMRMAPLGQGSGWGTSLPQYSYWSPAVDAGHAYAFMEGKLYAVRTDNGSIAYSIADPDYSWHGYDGVSPILSGKMAIVSDDQRLMGFDLTARARVWSLPGAYNRVPALANDTLYVVGTASNKLVLEARAPATGALLWSSEPLQDQNGAGWFNRVIVAGNLAFVSGENTTLAVDLKTGKTVWRHPFGGDMSISDRGVLYIQGINADISAVNLQ